MPEPTVIAVLGATGTGKSTLAAALQRALTAQGRRVARVDDLLSEFCAAGGRAPQALQWAGIAAEQSRRIDTAAQGHDVVIADTTALQLAVHCELLFGDRSLYEAAWRDHARCRHTLLCALDLPAGAEASKRHGAAPREAMDTLLRAALQGHAHGYSVVGGQGPARVACALAALRPAPAPDTSPPAGRWHWVCERCGDADCERHLLPRG